MRHRFLLAGAVVLPLLVSASSCRRSEPDAQPDNRAASTNDRIAGIRQLLESDSALAGVNASEARYARLYATVLEPWRRAFIARDGAAFDKLLTQADSGPAWSTSPRSLRREVDGVREHDWQLAPATGGTETAAYLAAFERVDDVQIQTTDFRGDDQVATLEVRYDLRGVTKNGTRRNDRGKLKLEAARAPDGWRLRSIQSAGMESLESAPSRKPSFEEATASLGLDRVEIVDRREAIRRGGYAIAAADYDGDGRSDLLVGNWGHVALYRNTGTGYVDATKAAGLRGETLVKSAAFADLDNDGQRDIVLVRFVDTVNTAGLRDDSFSGRVGDGELVAYRNAGGGKFEFKGNVLTRAHHYDRAMPLAIADFNNDGRLDIYIGFPGSRDFTNDLSRSKEAPTLRRQGLWLNDGKWGFSEAPTDGSALASGVAGTHPYPHAAVATDLDQDGRPDLVVVDDSGHLNPVLKNEGRGVFSDATRRMGLATPGWGMGATVGDFDGDGRTDLLMTNITASAAQRIFGGADGARMKQLAGDDMATGLLRSTYLYRNRGDGTFEEVSARAGLEWVGEGAAGAEWIDYDRDGDLDAFVMNGLWTGSGQEDATSLFLRLSIARRNDGDRLDPGMSRPGDKEPNPMLSILREYRGSLSDPSAAPLDHPSLSMAGSQHKRLFRNNGDGTFTEVGYQEGVDRVEDGYVAAVSDVDADGRQDLVLRNADPAPGVRYPTVVVLRNVTASGNSLTVFAKGGASNRDGIGVLATAYVGGKRIVREIHSANGASQGDPVAFFGLGSGSKIDKLEIRWPSGRVDTFHSVSAGTITVREGASLELAGLDVPPRSTR